MKESDADSEGSIGESTPGSWLSYPYCYTTQTLEALYFTSILESFQVS